MGVADKICKRSGERSRGGESGRGRVGNGKDSVMVGPHRGVWEYSILDGGHPPIDSHALRSHPFPTTPEESQRLALLLNFCYLNMTGL